MDTQIGTEETYHRHQKIPNNHNEDTEVVRHPGSEVVRHQESEIVRTTGSEIVRHYLGGLKSLDTMV